MLLISSEQLEVAIAEDRGAEIRFLGAPGGENLLFFENWRSPARASRSVTYGDSVLDFLSEYRGGWQELFPNPGAPSTVAGTPLPFHGEICASQWEVLEAGNTKVKLAAASRLPLVLERTLSVIENVLKVEETVSNESDAPITFGWGHHPAFVVQPGRIDLPAGPVEADANFDNDLVDVVPGGRGEWPTLPGKAGDVNLSILPAQKRERFCYLPDRPEGWAAIRYDSGTGVAMAWDLQAWPHVWFWQQNGGPGLPWYGRARISAIEPVNLWPADGLAAGAERGQGLTVPVLGSRSAWLTLALIHADERPVRRVDRDGAVEY